MFASLVIKSFKIVTTRKQDKNIRRSNVDQDLITNYATDPESQVEGQYSDENEYPEESGWFWPGEEAAGSKNPSRESTPHLPTMRSTPSPRAVTPVFMYKLSRCKAFDDITQAVNSNQKNTQVESDAAQEGSKLILVQG